MKKKKVAVLIESSRTYSRDLIRGIAKYNNDRGNWLLDFTPRGLEEPPPAWLESWDGDGVLVRINDRNMARAVAKLKVPVIDFRRNVSSPAFPTIGPDDRLVIQMLMEHFRNRGFRKFGFVGIADPNNTSMQSRYRSFLEMTRERGDVVQTLILKTSSTGGPLKSDFRNIKKWLGRLPDQTAVIGCNDDVALKVLNACRFIGLDVPSRIAIAGIGNDQCLCELGTPGLTSVDLDPESIGYLAASMLDRMMCENFVPPRGTLTSPRRIVVRASTNAISTDDDYLIKALQYIRENVFQGIRVTDVVKHVFLSRTALENRFQRTLGHSIHKEIQRIRLERVQYLLLTTEKTVTQIAHESGFAYPEYMMRIFRKETGQTLKEYRSSNR